MSTWIFEPGHTAAEFRARHMMVTWVRGLFPDIHGELNSIGTAASTRPSGRIDAASSGPASPLATPTSAAPTSSTSTTTPRSASAATSPNARRDRVQGRGRPDDPRHDRTVPLDIAYSGEWKTPLWDGDEN